MLGNSVFGPRTVTVLFSYATICPIRMMVVSTHSNRNSNSPFRSITFCPIDCSTVIAISTGRAWHENVLIPLTTVCMRIVNVPSFSVMLWLIIYMLILKEKKFKDDRDPSGIDEIVSPLGGSIPSSIIPAY